MWLTRKEAVNQSVSESRLSQAVFLLFTAGFHRNIIKTSVKFYKSKLIYVYNDKPTPGGQIYLVYTVDITRALAALHRRNISTVRTGLCPPIKDGFSVNPEQLNPFHLFSLEFRLLSCCRRSRFTFLSTTRHPARRDWPPSWQRRSKSASPSESDSSSTSRKACTTQEETAQKRKSESEYKAWPPKWNGHPLKGEKQTSQNTLYFLESNISEKTTDKVFAASMKQTSEPM